MSPSSRRGALENCRPTTLAARRLHDRTPFVDLRTSKRDEDISPEIELHSDGDRPSSYDFVRDYEPPFSSPYGSPYGPGDGQDVWRRPLLVEEDGSFPPHAPGEWLRSHLAHDERPPIAG